MPNRIHTYEQAIEWLFSRINYERMDAGAFGVAEFKLDRMRLLLKKLGDPQETIPVAHIAGTKGKGSTAAMLARVIQSAGMRVGLYTSPHLTAFEERIRVDGVQPTQAELVSLVQQIQPVVLELDKLPGASSPTYFEMATALAWLHFVNQRVELAVLEVGLGGRLDATNVCQPEVTVITSISRDHTRQLGATIDLIAAEKAGIAKPGIPLVSGVTAPAARDVIRDVCRRVGSQLLELETDFVWRASEEPSSAGTSTGKTLPPPSALIDVTVGAQRFEALRLALMGAHQAQNASLAVAAATVLRSRGWPITADHVRTGLQSVSWPGRFEIVRRSPTVVVDAAHNWASIRSVMNTLREQFPGVPRRLIFAASRDKDVVGMLRLVLCEFDTVILTGFQSNPRAVRAEELARIADGLSDRPVHVVPEPNDAWQLALRWSSPGDVICVTGSIFIVGELRDVIIDRESQLLEAASG